MKTVKEYLNEIKAALNEKVYVVKDLPMFASDDEKEVKKWVKSVTKKATKITAKWDNDDGAMVANVTFKTVNDAKAFLKIYHDDDSLTDKELMSGIS